ncbi:MAG: bifunctional aldolase/short-chain dehydrogenase [Rhodospirillaceae bacterium]|nr:bifunctional aldolase/short-chain dehydrogenase [Rhodospirillaceae bacterium]
MQSLWRDEDAADLIARYGAEGIGRDIALCLYMTRLLGGDRRLVLHGGGNSSVKTQVRDITGVDTEILSVKASGSDMARAGPHDYAALRLDGLRRLRSLSELADAEMRGAQRACLLDGSSRDPSVETLLHAFLPHKFIAHCHANAVLSVINQANGEEIANALFADCAAVLPYTMSGLALAHRAAEAYAVQPDALGLVLMQHGLVCFAEDARTAYENMIALVNRAEKTIAAGRSSSAVTARHPAGLACSDVAPILRGATALAGQQDGEADGPDRVVMDFRTNPDVLNYLAGTDMTRYAVAGVATPDHVIRTKNKPLILSVSDDAEAFRQSTEAALETYVTDYQAYLARHATADQNISALADARPRVALLPGLGLFAFGRSMAEAKIVADIAEAQIDVVLGAEAVGRYQPAAESDIFAIESWSLEQAKLAKIRAPLAGQVAVITGGAGAIGAATARTFAEAGAAIAVLDLDGGKAEQIASEFAAAGLGLACDVTDESSVQHAYQRVTETFGGVDILVSNAGAAWQGRIGEVGEDILRQSFELNFFAHQRMAQHAVRIMQAQASGGCLLFNTSKQAINPGADFGPYGLPKAATMFLVRQYALDHGRDGIRANAVNADRIRSGLLSDKMIGERAAARGVSEHDYMAGNLLGQEVTAVDVARAFLHQALALKTTGNVATVDGGNIAAALR